MITNKTKLTAANLKEELWETLKMLKDDKFNAAQADSIASQAREILRTTKTQLQIASQSGRSIPSDVLEFSENKISEE